MMPQQSTVPDRLVVAEFLRGSHDILTQRLELRFRKAHWSPRTHAFSKALQAIPPEQLNPIVDATRCVPKQFRNLIGASPVNGHQNSQAVCVGLRQPENPYNLDRKENQCAVLSEPI